MSSTGGGVGVLPLTPHGEVTWYINASDYRVRRQGRRSGDLQGVVPMGFEVGGVLDRGFTGKGGNSG